MWIPKEDTDLTIMLPCEMTRATVRRYVDPNTVIVELTAVPMTKGHSYRFGDLVAVRRKIDYRNMEIWAAIEERKTLAPEVENAVEPGLKQSRDKPKHKGDGRKRPPATGRRRRRTVKRKKAPKGRRRARAV